MTLLFLPEHVLHPEVRQGNSPPHSLQNFKVLTATCRSLSLRTPSLTRNLRYFLTSLFISGCPTAIGAREGATTLWYIVCGGNPLTPGASRWWWGGGGRVAR